MTLSNTNNIMIKNQHCEMQTLPSIKLVGITVRTNNKHEMSSNETESKIAQIVAKYFAEGLAEKIEARKTPGTTICAYTNYENGVEGYYDFFIGEAVDEFSSKFHDSMTKLTVPAGNYKKFISEQGSMPKVCIDLWKKIWQMDESKLGGKRKYDVDFEVYDKRAEDLSNTVLDIYIGIK